MSAKRAVVSLANEAGNYRLGLQRLGASLPLYTTFFPFQSEAEVGAPPHAWLPYAFKVYAIKKVKEMGYDQVLWLDSSCVAVRDIQPVWDHLEEHGYLMQEAGHLIGRWLSPIAELEMQVTEREKRHPMYGNAGMLGLDFRNEQAAAFFKQWFDYRYLFQGAWDIHRHDMVVGSVIAARMGMRFVSGNEWLDYAAPDATPKNETIILHAQGL